MTFEADAGWFDPSEAAARLEPELTRGQLLDVAVRLDVLGLDDVAERLVGLDAPAPVHAPLRRRAGAVSSR